jgi:integrase
MTAKPNKKAATWANDRSVINRHIKPLLGRKLAKDLTRKDVEAFQADVAAGKTAADQRTKPRGRAIVTGGRRAASLATVTLRALLQAAVEADELTTNPASGAQLFRMMARSRFLSEPEVGVLADAISELEKERALSTAVADALRLLLLTGARKSEIFGLRWGWVDLEREQVRLPDSKTGAKVVPLAVPAADVLRRQPRGASVYVFPSARGEGHITSVAVERGRSRTA